jgi:hypothetical protein
MSNEDSPLSMVTSLEKANVIEIDLSSKSDEEIRSISADITSQIYPIGGSKTVSVNNPEGSKKVVISELTTGSFERMGVELEDLIAHIRTQMGLTVQFFEKDTTDQGDIFINKKRPSQPLLDT